VEHLKSMQDFFVIDVYKFEWENCRQLKLLTKVIDKK